MSRIEEIEVLKIYYMRAVIHRDETKEELDKVQSDMSGENMTELQGAECNVYERGKELRRALRKHNLDLDSLVWDMPEEYVKIADIGTAENRENVSESVPF